MALIYLHANDEPLRLNLQLLKEQKGWLMRQTGEEAEGLLGIIDFLQDHLVDNLGYSKGEVFDSEDPDE